MRRMSYVISELGWLAVSAFLAYLIIMLITLELDNRPDNIKYIEDSRNGCKVSQVVKLANHQIHIRKDEYKAMVLYVYQCNGGNVAANIVKE